MYPFFCPLVYVHCDLELWPVTSKINRINSITMVNMSAKFDKEVHNDLVSMMFTSLLCSQAYYHIYLFWPWPLTSKINRVHPLTMANKSDQFDEESHNHLGSIMFTSLFPYIYQLWPWPLTSVLQNQKSSSSRHSEHVCQVWWRRTWWFGPFGVHKVKRTDGHTHMDGTTAALLYPHRNALRGDNEWFCHKESYSRKRQHTFLPVPVSSSRRCRPSSGPRDPVGKI